MTARHGLSMNASGRHKQVLCMHEDLDLILSIHQPAHLPTTSNLYREEQRGKGGDFANYIKHLLQIEDLRQVSLHSVPLEEQVPPFTAPGISLAERG